VEGLLKSRFCNNYNCKTFVSYLVFSLILSCGSAIDKIKKENVDVGVVNDVSVKNDVLPIFSLNKTGLEWLDVTYEGDRVFKLAFNDDKKIMSMFLRVALRGNNGRVVSLDNSTYLSFNASLSGFSYEASYLAEFFNNIPDGKMNVEERCLLSFCLNNGILLDDHGVFIAQTGDVIACLNEEKVGCYHEMVHVSFRKNADFSTYVRDFLYKDVYFFNVLKRWLISLNYDDDVFFDEAAAYLIANPEIFFRFAGVYSYDVARLRVSRERFLTSCKFSICLSATVY